MANEGWIVTGIPETVRALRALDADAAKRLVKAMKAISEHVVKIAKGRMEFGPGPIMDSVKPGAGVRGAWISFPKGGSGSGHDPLGYYPWLDFGGGVPWGRGVTASSPIAHVKSTAGFRRPKTMTGGRYIYPAIDASRRDGFIRDEAIKALIAAAKNENFRTEIT
jgi:hypothetical protein